MGWLDRRHARRERRDPTVVSVTRRLSGSVASEASVNTVRAENCGSQCTDGASSAHRDVSSSILSARGSCYQEVVASDNVCYICYEAKPDAIFLECGHGGMCTLCALELKNRRQTCPICRGVITHIVRVLPSGPTQTRKKQTRGAHTPQQDSAPTERCGHDAN